MRRRRMSRRMRRRVMGMRRRRMRSTSRMKDMDIYNIYIYIFDAVMRT